MSALLTPAAGVATVVPPLATKLVVEPWLPSSVTAVLLSSVLAATKPPPVVLVGVWKSAVVVAVDAANPSESSVPVVAAAAPPAPTNTPLLFTVPSVTMLDILPEHAAPLGQQATFPAKSAEQTALDAQHTPGAPRLAQFLKSLGQLSLCRLSSSCWTVWLERLEGM